MTDDPLGALRRSLVGAARAHANARRRRRAILLAAVATAIVVPVGAAATGVVGSDPDRGTFPDRSSFRVGTVSDPRGGAGRCDRVEYRSASGSLEGSVVSCPASPAGPADDGELPTSFSASPGRVVLLLGRTPRGTARVEVPQAVGEVAFDPAAHRFAAQVPRDRPMLAIARDGDGRELARFAMAAMQPARSQR